jgi:hypothetical protein
MTYIYNPSYAGGTWMTRQENARATWHLKAHGEDLECVYRYHPIEKNYLFISTSTHSGFSFIVPIKICVGYFKTSVYVFKNQDKSVTRFSLSCCLLSAQT